MSVIYLECAMGAAGDMLTAALLELHPNPKGFIEKLNNCGIPGTVIETETSVKCGISGTHMRVYLDGTEEHHHNHHGHTHHHSHEHMNVHEIEHIIGHLHIDNEVKNDVISVFNYLAEAESKVHGTTIDQIHFHEVGTMDAVADIVAVCMLMHELKPEKVYASPINVGSGTVKCAHGILPVPAPATAELLKGIPFYSGEIKSELCTPTGAALLKYFTDEFCSMPAMKVEKIGYGMGTKDFESPNCIRAYCGKTDINKDEVIELMCNIDDMSGEELGFATELLVDNGALDVWSTPIVMKKSRPAVKLSCLCKVSDADKFAELIFKHTTTIGIRTCLYSRYCLDRDVSVKHTDFGDIRVKKSHGWGIVKEKAEYDDVSKVALENGISICDVKKLIK